MRDRSVGLDRVDHLVALDGERVDRAVDGRHDADGEGGLVAERAADRRHGLTDDGRGRIAERHWREGMVLRIDPDQADVIEEIPADRVRLDAITVGELDIEMLSGVTLEPSPAFVITCEFVRM